MKTDKAYARIRHRGGARWATVIASFALAAIALSPPVMVAAVIDDFDGDQPEWDIWNPPTAPSEPPALAELLNGRLRISAHFTTPTDPTNPIPHLCNVYYSTNLPVRQGWTFELRTDLSSVSLDNLFACLITVDTKGGEYVLMRDRNEIALLKWSQTDGFSVAFWETTSIPYQVWILALALTPEGDDMLIETKVISMGNGQLLFERTVRDTAASDWGVPDPLPHGWQIFGPDAGPPYTEDLKGVGLGMLHHTDGQQGTAIMQFDNLEYRSGVLDIQKTVTVRWPEDTVEEMIVLGADSVDSTAWAPYPGPIAKQFSQFCIAVPTTQNEQHFKLVPGTHFIDDFSDPRQPFATRREYRLFFQNPGEEVEVSDGAMRVYRTGATTGGMAITPPDDVVVGDFYTSVDILSMTTSADNYLVVSLLARTKLTGEPLQMCGGGLLLNRSGVRGKVQTFIGAETEIWGPDFTIEAKPPPYRLEFSGMGPNLQLRVLSLTSKELIAQQTLTHYLPLTKGVVGLWVRGPNNDPTTHEAILDNFFVTGTTP